MRRSRGLLGPFLFPIAGVFVFGGWGAAPDRPKAVVAFGLSEGASLPLVEARSACLLVFGFLG